MYYWNKENFEGLLDLARELGETPALAGLARYCVLREQGLRKQALRRLSEFLVQASTWALESARRHVLRILAADARTREVHQFMTHPLLTELIYPVLERWRLEQPTAIEPLRWLGLLRLDASALEEALELDPSDVPVRGRLINMALRDADYSTHHLSESILLLTVEETRASIAAARALIASAPDARAFDYLAAEADEYASLVHDWEAYIQARAGTFPEWCAQRGRRYAWPTIIYYDAPRLAEG